MPNVKNNASTQETRRRLLDAAGHVFAARGLHAATIKEITARAHVNLAAINYHFRDKFELYAAVIRHALNSTRLHAASLPDAGSPHRRLRACIASMVDDLYDPERPPWTAAVLAHEFAQPTAAVTAVIDEMIRPRVAYIHQIIRALLGPHASEEQVTRAGMSVTAQCFLYLTSSQVIRRLHPHLLHPNQKQALINHIYQFSCAGLRGLRTQRQPAPAPHSPKPRKGSPPRPVG